jgi:hypothetical protein
VAKQKRKVRKHVHVTYIKQSKTSSACRMWKTTGSWPEESSCSLYGRKVDAIEAARFIAIEGKAELVIHNMNGRISRKYSYGSDPRNIKG